MSYATQADLVAAYGQAEVDQLIDRDGVGGPDPSVLDAALDDADSEIDAYLRGRYTLPLSPVPRLIVRIAGDIARYRLWSAQASEEVRARYEDARRVLESIASGKVRLGAAPVSPSGSTLTGGTMEVAQGTRDRDWGMLA